MSMRRYANARVAVRHGHCKVYCSIDDVARVTSNLSFSQPVQTEAYQSGGSAHVPDTSSLICELALGVQQRIAAKFSGVPIATLADGLRALRRSGRNTGLDKAIGKKLRSLNDAASFIRHFSPGYESGLYVALDEQLSKLEIDSRGPGRIEGYVGDSIDTLLPPPAPPPLEVIESVLNVDHIRASDLATQSQALIAAQNDVIFALSQHANNADVMLQSMFHAAASSRTLESSIDERLRNIEDCSRQQESDLLDKLNSIDEKMRDLSGHNPEQIVGISCASVGVQVEADETSASTSFKARIAKFESKSTALVQTDLLRNAHVVRKARGVQAGVTSVNIGIQTDVIYDESSESDAEESGESELSADFEPDDIMSMSEVSDLISICVEEYVDKVVEITTESGVQMFQATGTFRRDAEAVLIAFDMNGGYHEFPTSMFDTCSIRIVRPL